MEFNEKLLEKLKILNHPLKISIVMTPIALGISLALEWLIASAVTSTTVWITIPVAFILTYLVTSIMFRYQRLIDEKNTLLRAITRDLRKANETMAVQNQDLDAFAHTVAHELKTPLGVILGYSHLLGKKEYNQNPERVTESYCAWSRS